METVQAIQVLDGASVTSMSFEASDGPLTLSEQDGAWQMEGDGAFPLDQDQAGEYAQLLASLTATRRHYRRRPAGRLRPGNPLLYRGGDPG